MRRVLSSLIVLAILVGMFVCLGAQAFAAQEDIAVFAVTDEQLSSEMIARLQEQCSGSLLIDVNGFAEGQDQLGYNVVWVEQDPVVMSMNLMDAAKVWPGFAISQQVGPNGQTVVIVGVGEATTADEVAGAIASVGADGSEFTVAVGPAAAAESVKNLVKLFLVSGETDGAISDLEGTKVVHVAKADAPVAAVFVGADGAITSAENMPLPVADDPNVGTVEPQADDPNAGPVENEQSTEPTPVPVYDVIYKGNGGAGAMQDDFDFQSDLEYYFHQNGYTAPEGQEFAGWMIEGDETNTIYQPNDSIYLDRDITVLAQWKDTEPSTGDLGIGVGPAGGPLFSLVQVSFDANGGSGTMEPQQAALDANYQLPENGFTAPEGYHFLCWQAPDKTDYNPGDNYMISGETTFTAQWEEDVEPEQTFTVTYVPGEGATGTPQTVTATATKQLGMIPKPDDFDKPGYTFTGWDMDGSVYGVGDQFYVDDDTVITAVWTENEQFAASSATITFQPGEGIGDAYTETVDLSNVSPDSLEDGKVRYGVPECQFTAPAGKTFDGWKNEADGQVYMPERADTSKEIPAQLLLAAGDNVTLTAQWKASEQQPVGYVIHFYAGADNAEGTMEDATVTDGKLVLPECKYTVPGLAFNGWNVGDINDPVAAGVTIDVTGPMDIFATWKQAVTTYTVTYKANGGTGSDTTAPAEENTQITLPTAGFTAPSGQEFDFWTVENGDGTKYPMGSTYTVTADVAFLANWKPLTSQDPGATTTDMLMYTQGGTDEPSLTFENAKIATVAFDNTALAVGTQYALSNDDKTVTISNEFLDTQSAGQHSVAVAFLPGDNGVTYAAATRTIDIKAPAAASPENPGATTIVKDWDRTLDLVVDFTANGKTPSTVEIYYGPNDYKKAESGSDYTISGNVLTLKKEMINGRWGGQWPNATYNFKVTATDGTVFTLQVKLTGTAPTTAPNATTVPTANGNVPVTGDETPLVLNIVILVVLIAALAAVIIFVVVKRKRER